MSTTPTAAPSRAKRSAPARPIPEAAAVTMPILLSSRMVLFPSLHPLSGCLGRDLPAVVEGVEGGAVHLADDMTLDFEGRRHLAIGDGKGFARDHEAPHAFDRRKSPVDPGHDGADRPGKFGIPGKRAEVLGGAIWG